MPCGFAWYLTSVCFLLVVGEKGVSQKYLLCMLRKPAGRLGVVSPCERSENGGGVGEGGC